MVNIKKEIVKNKSINNNKYLLYLFLIIILCFLVILVYTFTKDNNPYIYKNETLDVNFDNNPIVADSLVFKNQRSMQDSVIDNMQLIKYPNIYLPLIKGSMVWTKYGYTSKDNNSYKYLFGSGFIYFINSNRKMMILTNRHLVDCGYNSKCFERSNEVISVRTNDTRLHIVSKVYFPKDNVDVAILEVNLDDDYNYSSVSVSDNTLKLDKVMAIGFYETLKGDSFELSMSEGIVGSFIQTLTIDGLNIDSIQSNVYNNYGAKSGALFDGYGNMIGITTYSQTLNSLYAIRMNNLRNIKFYYCDNNTYFANNICNQYCSFDESLGADGLCYKKCESFYCNSDIFKAKFSFTCEDNMVKVGSQCMNTCGSSSSYCESNNSYCFKNSCVKCDEGKLLYKDGVCR